MKSFTGFLHECETHLNFTYAKQKYRYTLMCNRKKNHKHCDICWKENIIVPNILSIIISKQRQHDKLYVSYTSDSTVKPMAIMVIPVTKHQNTFWNHMYLQRLMNDTEISELLKTNWLGNANGLYDACKYEY